MLPGWKDGMAPGRQWIRQALSRDGLPPAVRAWLEAEVAKDAAAIKAMDLFGEAHAAILPAALRPAIAEDIVPGALIWYSGTAYADRPWRIVTQVLRPDDAFKAFVAEDGGRYGLRGARIEVTKADLPGASGSQ